LASDIGCAAEFAAAAVAACAYNVRVNHRAMRDSALVATQAVEMERYERESATLLRRVRETVR
jgi:formiminotetrahydrofolate cyclodeaminase